MFLSPIFKHRSWKGPAQFIAEMMEMPSILCDRAWMKGVDQFESSGNRPSKERSLVCV